MDWTGYAIFAGVVLAFLLIKRLGLVGAEAAQGYLRQGAKVLDVRTEEEYRRGHLPGAINLPLDRLQQAIGGQAPDKEQALLLHCLSGTRSGVAKRMLRQMGYRQVFNLGSYGRAARIVGRAK